jgi:enediyne polyketide synthase
VTAILHAAGVNTPALLHTLDERAFTNAIAPKVAGARNLLNAVDVDRLRLFVTFGSVIARSGMRGEAHYALANEWLASLTDTFQAEHPACRCVAIEWSVWAGAGMGERLGRVDALMREGINPIPVGEGVSMLARVMAWRDSPTRVVVMGRSADLPTLAIERPELPLWRFLERPRVYYPGLELVVDCDMSVDTDPYVADHAFAREQLLPAVIGLEAMAQSAMVLLSTDSPPSFEDVRFDHAIVVPDRGSVGLRIAARVRRAGRVDVVIRCSTTAFHVDHFRATCVIASKAPSAVRERTVPISAPNPTPVRVDPDRDLYGLLLFQQGRFRRVKRYDHLRPTECVAELATGRSSDWFGAYLDGTLVLGDPGLRDAALHAIQPCIPHLALLPVAVDRILPSASPDSGARQVHARERAHAGDTFTYDMELRSADGCVERWEGLRLRAAGPTTIASAWSEGLLGIYVERRVRDFVPQSDVHIVLAREKASSRHESSDRLIRQLLGPVEILRRPDGKPELSRDPSMHVSVADADEVTLVVAGANAVGCDIEPVVPRSRAVWCDLLGAERSALATTMPFQATDGADGCATRVWTMLEALAKAGASRDEPLVIVRTEPDGWVLLRAGAFQVASYIATLPRPQPPLALAVVARESHASL